VRRDPCSPAAEAEVRELYRLREIERARKAVRDPSQPLH